jgi:hypothetical protein
MLFPLRSVNLFPVLTPQPELVKNVNGNFELWAEKGFLSANLVVFVRDVN